MPAPDPVLAELSPPAQHLPARVWMLLTTGTLRASIGWFANIALGVLLLQRTDTALALAATTATRALPQLLGPGIAAWCCDRLGPALGHTLARSLAVCAYLALGLALLTSPAPSLTLLVLVQLTLGVGDALGRPCLASSLLALAGPERPLRSRALAAQGRAANLARVMGCLAGGLLATLEASSVLFLSYAALALVLLLAAAAVIGNAPPARKATGRGWPRGMWADPLTRGVLVGFGVLCLLSVNLGPLALLLADVWSLSPTSYGVVYGALGVGGLLGSARWADRDGHALPAYPAALGLALAASLLALLLGLVATPSLPHVILATLGMVGFGAFAAMTVGRIRLTVIHAGGDEQIPATSSLIDNLLNGTTVIGAALLATTLSLTAWRPSFFLVAALGALAAAACAYRAHRLDPGRL